MGATIEGRVERFVGKVALHLQREGWGFTISDSRKLMTGEQSDGGPCTGYADEDGKLLCIAGASDRWLEALAHEYGHFLVWESRKPADRRRMSDVYGVNFDVLDRWVKHKKTKLVTSADAWKAAKVLAMEEALAEESALRLIGEHRLPVDRIKYRRASCCYVLSFGWVVESREWKRSGWFDDPEFIGRFPAAGSMIELAKGLKAGYEKNRHLFG